MPSARGCNGCRLARVKCDGERPTCARCRRLRLCCAGYRDATALVIRNENAIAERNSMGRRQKGSTVASSTSRTAATTVERSKVRYIAQQRRIERDRLPWLGIVIPTELQPKTMDLAVSRFLAHYVLSPNAHMGDDGYMADLPHFYAHCISGSALRLAVESCALMSFSAATKSPDIRLEAQRTYGEALSGLRKATTLSASAVKDETLMALLILDYYSLLGDEEGSFPGPHSQGIAPLLQLRGAQQLFSTVGWNLFRIAHRRMQVRKMILREEPLVESFDWINALDPSHVEARLALNALQILKSCATIRRLLADSDSNLDEALRASAVQQAVSNLQALECATSVWPSTVPESWKPWTPHLETPPSTASSSGSVRVPWLYPDCWIATSFNWHRMTQLHLHETLRECWCYLQFSDTDDPSVDYSRQAATGVIDQILSSVPFMIGKLDPNGNEGLQPTLKEVGYHLAFVALQVVLVSPLASEAQIQEARSIRDNSKHGIL